MGIGRRGMGRRWGGYVIAVIAGDECPF